MSAIIDQMAHELAKDAIEAANALGDEELVVDIGKNLASSSTSRRGVYDRRACAHGPNSRAQNVE